MSIGMFNLRLEEIINNPNFKNMNSKYRFYSLFAEIVDHPAGFLLFHRLTFSQFCGLRQIIGTRVFHHLCPDVMCLSLTLRYLSRDDTIKLPLEVFDVHPNDLTDIVEKVCDAIIGFLRPEVFTDLNNEPLLNAIAEEFEKMWNFPRCVGAFEFRQIICQVSTNGELRSLKAPIGFLSDAFCRFNGFYILDPLFAAHKDNLSIPNFNFVANRYMTRFHMLISSQLEAGNYVTVGSNQSSLTRTHMRAYSTATQYHKRVFNHRLDRAHSVAENALGILFQRWRIFQSPIFIKNGTLMKIVGSTVMLHNWLIEIDLAPENSERTYTPDGFFVFRDVFKNLVPGNWGDYSITEGVERFINSCRSKTEEGEVKRNEIALTIVVRPGNYCHA